MKDIEFDLYLSLSLSLSLSLMWFNENVFKPLSIPETFLQGCGLFSAAFESHTCSC